MAFATAALLTVGAALAPAANARAATATDSVAFSGGRTVVDRGARDGRAIEVRRGRSALLRVAARPVERVTVRARAAGCPTATLLLRSKRSASPAEVTPRFRRHVVRLERPARTIRLKVISRAAECGIRVDPATVAVTPPPAPAAAPARRAVPLGAAVSAKHLEEPRYAQTLLSAFRSITPENELKMERTQPQQGSFDFAASDALVGFASEHGLDVRGHALVFGAQTPPWVARLILPNLVEDAMTDHIRTLVDRYKGRIRGWDVVNEALDDEGRWRHNPFYDALGPAYVEKAFRVAREADPTARLFYNEFAADVAGPKRDAVVKLVGHLKAQGLIDGIGLQMHVALDTAPSYDQLVDTIRVYERMGLDVEITEMDVASKGDGSPTYLPLRLSRQAAVYETAARACHDVSACKRLTVWGVTDRHSWLDPDQIPLLFDADHQPKPALAAVRAVVG